MQDTVVKVRFDHEKTSIVDALGIRDRSDALGEVFKELKKIDTVSERLEAIINDDELSAVEKVYMCFIIGGMAERIRIRQELAEFVLKHMM